MAVLAYFLDILRFGGTAKKKFAAHRFRNTALGIKI
jgi:hypothetical protein